MLLALASVPFSASTDITQGLDLWLLTVSFEHSLFHTSSVPYLLDYYSYIIY
jgi:hypothetical protein